MKNELQPLNIGVQELEHVLRGVKVCNASTAALEAVLRRAMLLVGIRASNLPSPVEREILTAFIYKKYAGLTLEEIQLAFEKAVAGELECEANCYENFSCAYFGQIMSAYKKWASQKFNENQMYIVPASAMVDREIENLMADWKELCEAYYQDYLNNKFVFSVMPWQLYDEFVKCGMMGENVYEDYIITAKSLLIWHLKEELFSAVSENEKEDLRLKLKCIENGENETKIEQQAKKLAVEILYKTAKEKGFKNLFVKA